jgi:hypothetical protein
MENIELRIVNKNPNPMVIKFQLRVYGDPPSNIFIGTYTNLQDTFNDPLLTMPLQFLLPHVSHTYLTNFTYYVARDSTQYVLDTQKINSNELQENIYFQYLKINRVYNLPNQIHQLSGKSSASSLDGKLDSPNTVFVTVKYPYTMNSFTNILVPVEYELEWYILPEKFNFQRRKLLLEFKTDYAKPYKITFLFDSTSCLGSCNFTLNQYTTRVHIIKISVPQGDILNGSFKITDLTEPSRVSASSSIAKSFFGFILFMLAFWNIFE